MRKKIILLWLALGLILTACGPKKTSTRDKIVEELSFKVEKMQFSKSFQTIEPYASFKQEKPIPDSEKTNIIVSGGLQESSGFQIDKIIKKSNELDIYVTSLLDGERQLAIPQALVVLDSKDLNIKDKDKIKFNIINEDAKLINIKFNINDVLSKLESQFQFNTSIKPSIELLKEDDSFYWNIDYDAIMDKEDSKLPLTEFNVKVNTDTGEVVEYKKEKIADPIDQGAIVNYFLDQYILYKKNIKDAKTESSQEELWIHNIKTGENTLLFTSDYTIISTQVSPDLSNISFIESRDGVSDLYIVPKKSKNAYKVSLEENINPVLNRWIDGSSLYLIEKKDGKSKIFSYSLDDKKADFIKDLDMDIAGLDIRDGNFLISEKHEKSLNKKIYVTRDWINLRYIDSGFNELFINNKTIAYLEDVDDKEANNIHIYDLEKGEEIFSSKGLINSLQYVNKDLIAFPCKMVGSNEYDMYTYQLEDNNIKKLAKCLTNKAYFNSGSKLIYININSPLEETGEMLIYPIKVK